MTPTRETPQQTIARLEVMDKLLSPFHLQTGPLVELHQRMMAKDPAFYGRLAVWNHTRGEARSEAFVATLLTSPSTEHRNAGFVLFQDFSPLQASRVVKILKRHLGKTPRSARAAVTSFLRSLEQDAPKFDQAVRENRRSLKYLYAGLHIRPSERADRILFKGEPLPEGSLVAVGTDDGAGVIRRDLNLSEPTIRRPTALLVDKSAGMEKCLELGKQLASLISDHAEADLHVYTFDLLPYLILPQGDDADAWDRAFRHIQAAGAMSAGNVLEAMRRKRQEVEQIVVVTGKDESTKPRFEEVFADYAAHLHTRPEVVVVQVGVGPEPFVDRLAGAGISVQGVEVEPDTLLDLLPRLSRPSRRDLLDQILAVPLPTRQAA